MGVQSQASQLHRQIADAQEKLRRLEKIPSRDDFAHGTVVRAVVNRRYGDPNELTYVFMKIVVPVDDRSRSGETRERWYFTGALTYLRNRPTAERWVSWDVLVSWLIDHVELVSWDVLTPLGVVKESISVELSLVSHPGTYAADRIVGHADDLTVGEKYRLRSERLY